MANIGYWLRRYINLHFTLLPVRSVARSLESGTSNLGTYLFCDPPSKIVENLLLGVVFRVEHESGVFFLI